MSSCTASCYTCSPKASSAFATSAFSPTGGGPLSCHFAGKPSLRFSRKPNHQPPPPRKPDRFGSVQLWRAHGGHREAYGGSDPAPFATLSLRSRRMKQPFPALSLGAPHHPQACCALLAPKPAVRSQPRPKIPFPPHANSHPTNPRLALAGSSTCSPSFSPNPNTIE